MARAAGADSSEARQIEIGGIGRDAGEPQPASPVVKLASGEKLRVTEFLPHAQLAQQWKDDNPNPAPAVLVHVSDSAGQRNLVLSPEFYRNRRTFGRGYVLTYRPGISPRELEQISRARFSRRQMSALRPMR